MLKKSASFVLASLRGSTYRTKYASPLRSLRPCWTAFLNILRTVVVRYDTFHDYLYAAREPRQNNRALLVCQAIRRLPRIKTDRLFCDPDLDAVVPFETSRDRSHGVLIRVAWIEGILDLL